MKNNSQVLFAAIIFCLFSTLALSCHPVPGPDKSFTGAVLGAGWGAGAGAVVGNQIDNTGAGAGLGAAFGATSGLLTGVGLDLSEGTELEHQRNMDALRIQLASNQRAISSMQAQLDDRDRKLGAGDFSEEVYFDSGKASIRLGAAKKIQRFADKLKSNPYVGRIELHGHADEMGDESKNQRLSEARARSVASFLANYGVSLDKISVEFHGATKPLASNKVAAGRQLNRRVEIVTHR